MQCSMSGMREMKDDVQAGSAAALGLFSLHIRGPHDAPVGSRTFTDAESARCEASASQQLGLSNAAGPGQRGRPPCGSRMLACLGGSFP